MGIPASVTTPTEFVSWLKDGFYYHLEANDDWQSPEETIRSKSGDCEDYALLASAFLSNIGYTENYVIIVKFSGLYTRHAICVFREKNGSYSFISNKKMFRTGQKSVRSAISKYYPDWEEITFSTHSKKYFKTIHR